jgi:hypothetical protein
LNILSVFQVYKTGACIEGDLNMNENQYSLAGWLKSLVIVALIAGIAEASILLSPIA